MGKNFRPSLLYEQARKRFLEKHPTAESKDREEALKWVSFLDSGLIGNLSLLATASGRYAEAKAWAKLGYEGILASQRRFMASPKLWPKPPKKGEPLRGNAGLFVVGASDAPILGRLSSPEPPQKAEAKQVGDALRYALAYDQREISDFLAYPNGQFSPGRLYHDPFSNSATYALFNGVLIPAIAAEDQRLIARGRALAAKFKAAHRGVPKRKPARRSMFDFHYYDAVLSAFFKGDGREFSNSLAAMWNARHVSAWDPRYNVGSEELLVLWLLWEGKTGKALDVRLDPPLEGFSPAAYWAA